jgi:hypothetical protein
MFSPILPHEPANPPAPRRQVLKILALGAAIVGALTIGLAQPVQDRMPRDWAERHKAE